MDKAPSKSEFENHSDHAPEKSAGSGYTRLKALIVYLLVLTAATAARIILFTNWANSPFRFYHKISGLDMKTIMATAEQFCNGKTDFSVYKFFVYCCYLAGGHHLNITTIITGELVLGVAVSILITFITYKILKNDIAALVSGMLAALYSPELMYESFTLIDSVYVFICVLSLAVIVQQGSKPGSCLWLLLSGIAAALPPLVRFPGILWTILALVWIIGYQLVRNEKHGNKGDAKYSVILPLTGLLIAFIPVCVFNFVNVNSINPIPAAPSSVYAFKAGLEANPIRHELPAKAPAENPRTFLDIADNYARKFFSIFNAYEMPDNLNYYFVREMLPPLDYLADPLLLIPFAVLGMLIMLMPRNTPLGLRPLLLVYLISFSIPMTVFMPLGRYKLVLLPVFCVTASHAISLMVAYISEIGKKKLSLFALAYAVTYAVIFACVSSKPIERAEDFVAYGNAMEAGGGYDRRDIEESYMMAYKLNPTISSAIHLSNFLMGNSEFAEASAILKDLYEKNPGNQAVCINYASSLLGLGKAPEAEKVLLGMIEPENRKSKVNYNYQLGESRRLQGKKAEALACYKLALEYSDTDGQRAYIRKAIDRLGQ